VLRNVVIRFVKESLAPHTAPLLSAYLNVNPAEPTNMGRAWQAHLKNALKNLDVPRDLAKKVIDKLEMERPVGRTYAIFAAEDLFKTYELHVDLPVIDIARGRAEARWGEPWVFPLAYALDEYERYGVVFADKANWRFFEVYLGEIAEVADAFLNLPTDHSRKLKKRPAQTFVEGLPLRGGAPGDRYERHVEAWVQRFYKQAAHRLEHLVDQWRITALILMGPSEDTHFFEQNLPRSLRTRVAMHTASLPEPGASAGQIMKRLEPVIASSIEAREMALLDEVRERGRWTISTVLQALQMGRVHLLVAPWNPGAKVLRASGGLVVEDPRELEAYCLEEPTAQEVNLRDVLPDLAEAHGARPEFVQGKAEARLHQEFGGLAGLSRW
jgi:hypothetical protein